MYCSRCKRILKQDEKFCPDCGMKIIPGSPQGNPSQQYAAQRKNRGQDSRNRGGRENRTEQKTVCRDQTERNLSILAYITLIGFLVVYMSSKVDWKKSSYLRFHMNQALTTTLMGFAYMATPLLPYSFRYIGTLWSICCFLCWLIGIIGAINGEKREIPLLGKIQILH